MPLTVLQELCRQRMAVRPPDRPEGPHTSRISSVSSQFSDGPMPSPSARSSTSSWSEEPVQSNMDISTGHMILVRPYLWQAEQPCHKLIPVLCCPASLGNDIPLEILQPLSPPLPLRSRQRRLCLVHMGYVRCLPQAHSQQWGRH